MIRLRQEFDGLLADKDMYFSGSSDRGERHLVIKSKCGIVLYTFHDIVFTKLTKKDIEYIKELIEPRMPKINKLLSQIKVEEDKLQKLRDKFYAKIDGSEIRQWGNHIGYSDNRLYYNDDYTIDHYDISFKSINEVKEKMKILENKLKELKELEEQDKVLGKLRKELDSCTI